MRITLALVILTMTILPAFSQESAILTEILRDTILIGNSGEVRYTANNLEVKFEGPDFDHLQIVSGPNVSTSMQFVNGKMTSSLSYSYVFYPQEVGEYFISPAYFNAQDTVYETPPISIIVLPNTKGEKQPKGKFKIIDHQSYNKVLKPDPSSAILKKKKKRI